MVLRPTSSTPSTKRTASPWFWPGFDIGLGLGFDLGLGLDLYLNLGLGLHLNLGLGLGKCLGLGVDLGLLSEVQ